MAGGTERKGPEEFGGDGAQERGSSFSWHTDLVQRLLAALGDGIAGG